MKDALWILIWSFGFPVGLAIGYMFENCIERIKRKKRKRNDKIKKSHRDFDNSIIATGERIKREIELDKLLKSEIRTAVKPVRKVCGVLASGEAQRILEN